MLRAVPKTNVALHPSSCSETTRAPRPLLPRGPAALPVSRSESRSRSECRRKGADVVERMQVTHEVDDAAAAIRTVRRPGQHDELLDQLRPVERRLRFAARSAHEAPFANR